MSRSQAARGLPCNLARRQARQRAPMPVLLVLMLVARVVHAETELLPDLEQDRPSEVAIRTVGPPGAPRYWLVFGSAVANVGAGPLVIEGIRPDRVRRRMRGDQLVLRADGSTRRVRAVGRLRYVV